MKHLPLLILAACCLALGCHRKESRDAASNPQNGAAGQKDAGSAEKQPQTPRNITANADNNLRQSVEGDVDQFLTAQLRIFVQKKGRLPQSFLEFKNASLDSMPRPPAGKKWAIDAASIQVKAVNAQ